VTVVVIAIYGIAMEALEESLNSPTLFNCR